MASLLLYPSQEVCASGFKKGVRRGEKSTFETTKVIMKMTQVTDRELFQGSVRTILSSDGGGGVCGNKSEHISKNKTKKRDTKLE